MMRKKYTLRQRIVMTLRNLGNSFESPWVSQCKGCGSGNVSGDDNSWICHNCGAGESRG